MGDSCDSDAEFAQHTTAQRAETRQSREDVDKLNDAPDSPQRKKTEQEGSGQEVRDGGYVVLHYKSATATPGESSDLDETDKATGTVEKSWAPLIPAFTMATAATQDEANELLSLTDGNLQEAVLLFMTNKLSKPPPQAVDAAVEEALKEALEEPKPPTLHDEALAAARPKRLQRDGEVVIVLDVDDLSKTFRLRSEDVDRASPLLKAEVAVHAGDDPSPHGVKHLFILQNTVDDGTMPLLERKPLGIMRADCDAKFYSETTLDANQERNQEPDKHIKVEDAAGCGTAMPPNDSVRGCTWVDAYEAVIRIIAFPAVNPGIPKTDIDKALEKIELVAQIAKAVQAVPSVSRALDSIFNALIQSQQLWSAIANDAVRWLLVGVNLEKPLIYNEAFTHVAGCYPEWPWSIPAAKLPRELWEMIAAKSLTLEMARKDVERKLLCLTLTREVDTTSKARPKPTYKAYISHQVNFMEFNVVSIFRDWVALHLAHIDSGDKGMPKTKSAICDHRDKECLTVAGLFRLISKGSDAYMPVETLLKDIWTDEIPLDENESGNIRSALKTVKTRAAKLVAPLLVSGLNFEGKDKLPYLTAVDVTDGDKPWDTRMAFDGVGEDDDNDEL